MLQSAPAVSARLATATGGREGGEWIVASGAALTVTLLHAGADRRTLTTRMTALAGTYVQLAGAAAVRARPAPRQAR